MSEHKTLIFCADDDIDYGSIHREALPLYGHPNVIKRGSRDVKMFPEVTQFCLENFKYTSRSRIPDAIMVFPAPFGLKEEMHDDYELYQKFSHRKIYGFSYNMDYFEYENVISYQTSLSKFSRTKNQFPFPPLIVDRFQNKFITDDQISIGWCGSRHFDREFFIGMIQDTKYPKDFTVYSEEKTGAADPEEVKKFFKNIQDNLFSFCIRGGANFCWRFYESLMMGRIPILVQSDRCFVFEDYGIDLNDVCVVLDLDIISILQGKIERKKVIQEIEEKIDSFIESKNLLETQINNREIWEKYCSPIGLIKNFKNRVQ